MSTVTNVVAERMTAPEAKAMFYGLAATLPKCETPLVTRQREIEVVS
jgi:hypothetical protein